MTLRPSKSSDPEVVQLEPRATLAVRVQEAMAGLSMGALFSRSIGLVARTAGESGVQIGGPAYARYYEFGPTVVDVEIGFPIVSVPVGTSDLDAVDAGTVGVSQLPGGPAVRITHFGPYNTLSAAFAALEAWFASHPDAERDSSPWESYVDDPASTPDHSQLRTEITWPLGKV